MKWRVLTLTVVLGCTPASATAPGPTPQIVYVTLPPTVETHPTLLVWGSRYSLSAGHYTALPLPDAFTVRIEFNATMPVRPRIMTLAEFAKFATSGTPGGTAYPASTNFEMTFYESSGCAAYVLVLDAENDATIYPNVTVTYAPASAPTGACAP